jgi:hypothetical protein
MVPRVLQFSTVPFNLQIFILLTYYGIGMIKIGVLSHTLKNIAPFLCCWFYNSTSMCNIRFIRIVSLAALNTCFKKGSYSADPMSWQF